MTSQSPSFAFLDLGTVFGTLADRFLMLVLRVFSLQELPPDRNHPACAFHRSFLFNWYFIEWKVFSEATTQSVHFFKTGIVHDYRFWIKGCKMKSFQSVYPRHGNICHSSKEYIIRQINNCIVKGQSLTLVNCHGICYSDRKLFAVDKEALKQHELPLTISIGHGSSM